MNMNRAPFTNITALALFFPARHRAPRVAPPPLRMHEVLDTQHKG